MPGASGRGRGAVAWPGRQTVKDPKASAQTMARCVGPGIGGLRRNEASPMTAAVDRDMNDPSSAAARNLLVRTASSGPDGLIVSVDSASVGLEFAELAIYELRAGQRVSRAADSRERLVLVLEGHVAIQVGERDFGRVGSRGSVFDGPPPPVLLAAPGVPLELTAAERALVAIAAAPGGDVSRTALVSPDEILVEARGTGQTARRVHHLLPPSAEAGRLIAFEVFTPGGNWSSFPPHKHDTEDPPNEARLEEIYFYRFAKPNGFAFQRVYTPRRDLDESVAPGDRDIVLVLHGYHPVAAAVGYDCYYLNVMAGPHRVWNFTVDPDHAWLMDWDAQAPTAMPQEASA